MRFSRNRADHCSDMLEISKLAIVSQLTTETISYRIALRLSHGSVVFELLC
jgi:hypothetical protein